MFFMLTNPGPKLLKAHGPVVRSGSAPFMGGGKTPVLSPVSFFRFLQGLGPLL